MATFLSCGGSAAVILRAGQCFQISPWSCLQTVLGMERGGSQSKAKSSGLSPAQPEPPASGDGWVRPEAGGAAVDGGGG